MSVTEQQSTDNKPSDNPYEHHIIPFSIDELNTDPEPAKFIWPGIQDEPGKVTAFVGAGALGKTALTAGVAIHRALGLPFLGRATKPGGTIIISKEDSRADYRRKMAAQRVALGAKFDAKKVAECVLLLDVVGDATMLVESSHGGAASVNDLLVQLWADAINKTGTKADLIILETASRLTPNEDNTGMSALVSACELLGRLTHCSTLLVHHTGKEAARNGVADSYTGRGGSSLADNARAVMVLTAYPRDQKARSRLGVAVPEEMTDHALVLSVPKLNGAPPPPPLVIEKVPTPWALTLRAFDRETLARAEADAHRRRVAEGVQPLARLVDAASKAGQTVTRRAIEKREVDGIKADTYPLDLLKEILDQALRCGALVEESGPRNCKVLKADLNWFTKFGPANSPMAA
jgi:RecA-family ATPase